MSEKATLLEVIAGQNRGLLTNETEKVTILSAIANLEDHNPNPKPVECLDLLEGNWRLLYTTNRSFLGFNVVPFLQPGQIYQCIRSAGFRVYNIAEVLGVPGLDGLVGVAARFESVSDCRVKVQFDRWIVGLQRFLTYDSPNALVQELEGGKKFPPLDFAIDNQNQKGWLETTYLDQDLRIGRGNEGSVFVLTKDS